MHNHQLYLFRSRKFLPIFITQFCGALNDNIFKSAVIILISYNLFEGHNNGTGALLVLLTNALFVVPTILFGGMAGQLADRYERTSITKILKLAEIFIIWIGYYGFKHNSLFILMTCVGLMGMHSTFFGPVKYAMLPDNIPKSRLLSANGLVEMGTFIGILIGSLGGGLYNYYPTFVLIIMFLVAIVGFISSIYIPPSNNFNNSIELNFNLLALNIELINYCRNKRKIFLALLGNSWFWFMGASFLSQVPMLAKDIVNGNEAVANLFLATFSLGVGAGSFLCNRIFSSEITTRYVLISAIGISLCSIDLFFATTTFVAYSTQGKLSGIVPFLLSSNSWRILFDLFIFSMMMGIYVVPIYTILQAFTPSTHRSRVIAATNVVNSIFIVTSSLLLSLLFKIGLQIPEVLLSLGLINLVIACYTYQITPDAEIIPTRFVYSIVRYILSILYKVEVKGIENFRNAGKRAVIISNHVSYLDSILIACYLNEDFTFAINRETASRSWVKPFLLFAKTYALDTQNPMAIKHLLKELKNNKKVVIFPEGRVSLTGSLMKIYEGPGALAIKANADIIPVRIEGAEYTYFSKLKKVVKLRFFPKIVISILPALKIDIDSDLNSRERKKIISQKLYDIMADMVFQTSGYKVTLFQSIINSAMSSGYGFNILEDHTGNSMSYRNLIAKSFILGDIISQNHHSGEIVGLMMPNVTSTIVSFLGMQSYGIIPAMVNFTSGIKNITSACKGAGIKTIYTSSKFINEAKLIELAAELEKSFKIVFLEDLREELTLTKKITGIVASFFPMWYYNHVCKNKNSKNIAVILFTSGTESVPKVVALSHENLCANVQQVLTKIDFNNNDITLNALPLFHTFGLSGTLLMLTRGVKMFLYPSPLHYKVIPQFFYDIAATIMFTTDTFLTMYAKNAHPYDFYSARYFFVGAEKLKDETRKIWFEKFGVRIFEGYGATECAPVITCNTPLHDKPGSVGRLMSCIDYKIEKVDGIEVGGKLLVKGPNVMIGYIGNTKDQGVGIRDGWYDTGDIVKIDSEGYVYILGREKRFAKIGGEMVSLLLIEETASKIDGDNLHGAVVLPCNLKGEKIILYTTSSELDKSIFRQKIKTEGLTEICIPEEIIKIDELPMLASGKLNYIALNTIAKQIN